MPSYHQMGNDSRNLLDQVSGYAGAIISPVNEVESDVAAMVAKHASNAFEFIFDPQLYVPRSEKGQLSTWDYFPRDFETADMGSIRWWQATNRSVLQTAVRVGASAVCAPVIKPSVYLNEYYEMMRTHADDLVAQAAGSVRVLQTVMARLSDLSAPGRAMEIASIASNTKVDGVYLVLVSDVKPRDELQDVEHLKGAMRLIRALEACQLPVLVACSSSDVVLWKTAGATSCATGKFANLRRFTIGRFDDSDTAGRQVPYWFEEQLLAFLRESDLIRVRAEGIASTTTNPFGVAILSQLRDSPGKPWVALGWRQYMHWFAEMERRLAAGEVTARDLIRSAEKSWQMLEEKDVFMEERSNDGSWLRPWLRAVVEYNR